MGSNGAPALRIAGDALSLEDAATSIAAYPTGTLRYYDAGAAPSNEVTVADVGRMTLINPRLSGNDTAALLELAPDAPWSEVPFEAALIDADPERRDGLYDGARGLHRYFTGIDGIGDAKASKLLYLKRPHLFPILDSVVQGAYERSARAIGGQSTRSTSRMYWAAIREDLLANGDVLPELRRRLKNNQSTSALLAAELPDQRLLDMLAWLNAR